jgi:glycosyltransferase involved in cell wall biosynthesis
VSKKLNIVLIIPAFNEAENLPLLFPRFKHVVASLEEIGYNAKMVVINDGSSDDTASISKQNGADIVSHPFNLGVCAALHSGFLYGVRNDVDILITVDADGQHNPEDIIYLINEFSNGAENVLIGSRFIKNTGYKKEFFRFAGIKAFSLLVKAVTKLEIHDVTSGFRVFDKDVIKFLAKNFPQEYPDAEVLIMLSKFGFKVGEKPLSMNPRLHGTSFHNWRTALTYPFKNLIAIIVVLLRSLRSKERMQA